MVDIEYLKELAETTKEELLASSFGHSDEVSAESIKYYLENITSLVLYRYVEEDEDDRDVYIAEIKNDFKSRIAKAIETNPKEIEAVMFVVTPFYLDITLYGIKIMVKRTGKVFVPVCLEDAYSLALALHIPHLGTVLHLGEPDYAENVTYEEVFSKFYGGDSWKHEKIKVAEINEENSKNGISEEVDFEEVRYYIENLAVLKDLSLTRYGNRLVAKSFAEASSFLMTELAHPLGIDKESIQGIRFEIEQYNDISKGSIIINYIKDGHICSEPSIKDDHTLGVLWHCGISIAADTCC